MDEKVSILIKKLDQLAIFLNIKFFQNITLSYYKTFDENFGKVQSIENELSDIVFSMDRQLAPVPGNQPSAASYGNTGPQQ